MEVRLLPHQLIGVSWMIDQERNSPHKGGILADDMGLGKTVQMIATMAINQPSDEDNSRTTLIVVPAALMFQWREEVETKTNGMFEVHIQHGREKIKDPQLLAEKDVRHYLTIAIRSLNLIALLLFATGCDHVVPNAQHRFPRPSRCRRQLRRNGVHQGERVRYLSCDILNRTQRER